MYLAIDLKSFYASVECIDRGLDPLTTNLVVADAGRTEKTICLAVSPSLKSYGVSGRARLFEVVQRIDEVNRERRRLLGKQLTGKSYDSPTLAEHPSLAVDYIVAPPRMARYMEVSTQIYQIYMKYVSPEDVHVYSIDEVFVDISGYLAVRGMTEREFAMLLIRDVLKTTGITATAGIGTNLFLAKVAMDIVAKRMTADRDGVRIAELDEENFRRELWSHRPLTDFWRVGKGYAKKLEQNHIYTMGDIARRSVYDEEFLYRLFGVNAELLIDHAWGWEPCRIADIKAYRPESHSLSSGQVLQNPYSCAKAELVVREMAELLVLDLVEQEFVTDHITLTVGYDRENMGGYTGATVLDPYGRTLPKPAHGSISLGAYTASTRAIVKAVTELYRRIVNPTLSVRRIYVVADHILPEGAAPESFEQLDFFTDHQAFAQKQLIEEKERKIQKTALSIKKKYGKNAIIKGMNLEEGATAVLRNRQIGGHKA